MNTTELLIANGQLVADTLRHLADNEIDSDYFAITSASENGTEIERELVITDYALQAASTVEALVEALESAQRKIAELEARTVTVKLPEVRITVSESRRRNLNWRELGAYNEGAEVAVEKMVRALFAAGIKCEVKGE